MADTLRRLVNVGSFNVLQEKLDNWYNDYYINSAEGNVNRCCELIELNTRIQGQLFKLLDVTASQAGYYGSQDVIRERLLPWLRKNGLFGLDPTVSALIDNATVDKERELNILKSSYERSLTGLEDELNVVKTEADDLKAQLEETQDALDSEKRASVSDKMFTESEVRDLRSKLCTAERELLQLRVRSPLVDGYARQARRLRQRLAELTDGQNTGRLEAAEADARYLRAKESTVADYETKISRLRRELSDLEVDRMVRGLPVRGTPRKYVSFPESEPMPPYRPPSVPRPYSPLSIDDVTQRVRQQNLITRFNDMFTQDRLDAMDILRRYSDDHENNQRIVFSALQEAFSSAKLSFANWKISVRATVAATHIGPETLEEAVQDYINRNTDLYDLPGLVAEVMRALNRNPRLHLPPDTSFAVIQVSPPPATIRAAHAVSLQPFIREAVKLAWGMSSLAHPLDIAAAADAELLDDSKYRRSYDSDYTAPLVDRHIWPALMQGLRVLVKGEACTRRGASLSPLRSRSPVRSPRARSPSPARSSARLRSRSPSPLRRSASPGARSRSPSRASSRAVTASTSLSHYGVRS